VHQVGNQYIHDVTTLENVWRIRDDVGEVCAGQLVHHIIVRISCQIRTLITSFTAFPFSYVMGTPQEGAECM